MIFFSITGNTTVIHYLEIVNILTRYTMYNINLLLLSFLKELNAMIVKN